MNAVFQDTTPRLWYLLGLGTGIVYSALGISLYLAVRGKVDFNSAYDLAKDWQTLIAGIIALAGAYITVHGLRAQDEDRRERKQYADRTALPSALVALHDYLKASLGILKSLRSGLSGSRIRFTTGWVRPAIPEIPFSAVEVIRACLETTDKDKRESLREILTQLQIQNSRLRGILRDVGPGSTMIVVEDNLADYIVHTLDLDVRCRNTIPYARDDAPSPFSRPSRDDMQNAAFFEDIHADEFPLVAQKIATRYH